MQFKLLNEDHHLTWIAMKIKSSRHSTSLSMQKKSSYLNGLKDNLTLNGFPTASKIISENNEWRQVLFTSHPQWLQQPQPILIPIKKETSLGHKTGCWCLFSQIRITSLGLQSSLTPFKLSVVKRLNVSRSHVHKVKVVQKDKALFLGPWHSGSGLLQIIGWTVTKRSFAKRFEGQREK